MKRKIINLLLSLVLIATCAFAFTACSDSSSETPPTPPTKTEWETAIAFDYNRFQYVVASDTGSITYKIDGDIAYELEQYDGQSTKETYIAKVGEQYFKYVKIETETIWQRNALTLNEYQEYMSEYKIANFADYFDYDSFTFDSSKKALVAETCGAFSDVAIYFNGGKITKMIYSRGETWTINLTYNDVILTVPTNIITINSEKWNSAFNFGDTDYAYTLKVNEETITVTVDGDNVRHQKTVDGTSTITTAFKDGDSYYTLSPYTSWETYYTHVAYVWEDYYQKTTVTNQTVTNLVNAYVNYLPAFAYSDFTFNKEDNNFTASSIVISEKQYTDVVIAFDDFDNLAKVEYSVIDASDATNVSIEFTFSDMTISKPDNIITYVSPIPEEYESSFSLTADNYTCVFEEYGMGYILPMRTKIEKSGNKICLSEMTSYNDDGYTKVTYYDKDGNNYYKYTFSSSDNVWYRIRITEKAYNEIVNIMLNIVLQYNGGYAFDHLSQGPYAYSVSAGSGEEMLTIFHVDYKVDRIVVGTFARGTSDGPEAQLLFDYGTASVTIPESQTAPQSLQLSEDWKTFFYRENYMDFTATIVSGDGKTSIYQSDYTNGTQTIYVNSNAYSNSSKQYVQKTADGQYTYEYLKSDGKTWYKQTSSVQYGTASDIKMFESKLSYTFACPDFSDYFSYFTYNEDKEIFEFNGTISLYVNGILGYTMFNLAYASVKINEDGKLDTVVIETTDAYKYTITFSNYGTTPSMTLPR